MAKRQGEKVVEGADVDRLLAIMKELDDAGKAQLLAGISSELTDAKKKAIITQLKKQAVVTDTQVKNWLINAITGTYVAGMVDTDAQLAKFGLKSKLGDITFDLIKATPDLAPHMMAMNSLLSDAYLDFGSGITGYVRGAEKMLNNVLRKQVQSKIALGRLEGKAIRDIKKQLITTLQDQGLEVLLDRGGRQWSLKRYSEMLSRTHVMRANTEATINRAGDFHVDIVEVSDHGTLCDVCKQYEGNIYSLSGKAKGYEKLPATPPFHPNCKHTLLMRPDLGDDEIVPIEKPPKETEVKMSDKDLKRTVDLKGEFELSEKKAKVYGVDIPLNKIESQTLNKNGVEISGGYVLTRSGNRSAKQPYGVFEQTLTRSGGQFAQTKPRIKLPPNANKAQTYAGIQHTFYHETGHAIDYLNGTMRAQLIIPKVEAQALVTERMTRNLSAGIARFKLSKENIQSYMAGSKVFVNAEKTKYIQMSRKNLKYYASKSEVFAESYAIFRTDPTKLKNLSPATYSFFENLTK